MRLRWRIREVSHWDCEVARGLRLCCLGGEAARSY